jgi:hypothetical protein
MNHGIIYFDAIYRAIRLTRRRLKHIFDKSSLGFEEALKQQTFPEILIDVSKYDDPRLLQKSLHLLNRCIHVHVCTIAIIPVAIL